MSTAMNLFGMIPVFAFCWALLVPLNAHAQPAATETQDEEARLHFQIGESALSDGRYQEALTNFQRSYELSQRPELLFNIGVAHDRLRHDEEALDHYRRFLAALPDAPNRNDAESRIAVLERTLAEEATEEEAAAAEEGASSPDLSPENVANQSADVNAAVAPTPHDESEGGIASKWWFWAIVGVVVIGAGVGIGVAAAGGDAPDIQNPVGERFETLRATF